MVVVVVCSAELSSLQLISTELALADDQTLNNQGFWCEFTELSSRGGAE